MESSQSRASAGSTCLSVPKVPPDYAAHIPPILGGHPVTASAAKPFFPESLPWPFFAYRKDWSRVGVATLQKIGQDWGKKIGKGIGKRLDVFF